MKNVTAVVCSWNAIQSIEKCLQSLLDNNIKIIVVDANSNDGSREVAVKYAHKVITDPRKGLGMARNLGIENVTTQYVLNWGADNILPKGQLELMLNCLEKNNFGGVSAQTFIICDKMNYFSKSLNLYKKTRYFPGQRTVIGTPTLFETKVLQKHKFDNAMTHSDDADLCTRLAEKGFNFAISDAYVYEIGYESISSIKERWERYGKSDFEIYSKYSKNWSLKRKIRSILHPLINEFILPLSKLAFINIIKILPFLTFITLLRYFFWIKFLIHKK